MISCVRGKLLECDLAGVVVDLHGLGLHLIIPMSTYDKLPRVGAEVSLLAHLHVREDALLLYGFATPEERRLFRLLLTVTGIGPRLALNILSCLPVGRFCECIANADAKSLAKVNGIGKRSAERLILELKSKIAEIEPTAVLGVGDRPDVSTSREAQDAIAALETLGFKSEAARNAVVKLSKEMPAEQLSAENLIRKALQALNS